MTPTNTPAPRATDEQVELLPCPFCGGDAKLEDCRTIWVARCCHCGACVLGTRSPEPDGNESEGYWSAFERSAVDAWNRRAPTAELLHLRVEVERLTAMVLSK